jgi:hypothetical protein
MGKSSETKAACVGLTGAAAAKAIGLNQLHGAPDKNASAKNVAAKNVAAKNISAKIVPAPIGSSGPRLADHLPSR